MNIGELIRKYRIEKGMTQLELAEKIGINQVALCQYELNVRKPKVDRVMQLVKILDIPLHYLMDYEEGKNNLKTLADYSTLELLEELIKRNRLEQNKIDRKNDPKKSCGKYNDLEL